MQHSYDFVLKGAVEPLATALNAAGAQVSAEGQGILKLTGGEATVQVLREAGEVVGLDVRVPFKDTTDFVEAVVKLLIDVAAQTQAGLVDPQRGDMVTLSNFSAVADEYLRMARYAGEYGGVSEALGLSSLAKMPAAEDSQVKWLLALAVFVIAIYGGWKLMTAATFDEGEEPPQTLDAGARSP